MRMVRPTAMIGKPTGRDTARNVPVGRVSARIAMAIPCTRKIAPMIVVSITEMRRMAGSASRCRP